MIHPMWAEFAKVAIAAWIPGSRLGVDESPEDCRRRLAIASGQMADLMCAEYDKRDKVSGGSPYRS